MSKLSHIDDTGAAHMVDVGKKAATERFALAQAVVRAKPSTIAAILDGNLPKGDVLAAARLAGIMAAKKTSDLIPLCHPLPLTSVTVDIAQMGEDAFSIRTSARTTAPTGVEMEALTAASIAALTLYDMAKAVDKGIRIQDVRLLEKTGGKSGDYKSGDYKAGDEG